MYNDQNFKPSYYFYIHSVLIHVTYFSVLIYVITYIPNFIGVFLCLIKNMNNLLFIKYAYASVISILFCSYI